jgi:hypothetical protein
MYRLLTPILALIVAITLFFTFIQPQFDDYKRLDTDIADYDQALKRAQELQDRVNELVAEKNAINQSELERLQNLLPDSVDEVATVLALDALSAKHQMTLKGIAVGAQTKGVAGGAGSGKVAFSDEKTTQTARPDGTVVAQPTDVVETKSLTFGLTGTYDNFKKFLADIENSLALMDIASLTISEPADSNISTFAISVNMYQFKYTNE